MRRRRPRRTLFASVGDYIVPAHPPVATGFCVAGLDLMDDVLPEAIFLLGGVPLVHGATTVGSSLIQAHQRMESLEHAARIMLTARMLGRVNALTPENAQTLRATRVATHQASQQKTQTRSL